MLYNEESAIETTSYACYSMCAAISDLEFDFSEAERKNTLSDGSVSN